MRRPAYAVLSSQWATECSVCHWRNVSPTFSSHTPAMPGHNAETNFAFTSKKPWQSSVIAHNLIVVTKTWVQVFWFEVLCAVSRDHDRALVIFVLTMSQFIFIVSVQLIGYYLSFSWALPSLSPFFLFSFLPSILSLPRAASTWTWQRLSSLVCTCVPRSFSRQAWFHNPDFSSVFHKTDDGVDAETFFARFFWNKVNFTFASFENLSAIMHVKSKRSFNLLKMPGQFRVSCSARTSGRRILSQALSGATALPVLLHGR